MGDTVLTYTAQLGIITAAAMALAEWVPLRIGVEGQTRKRYRHALFVLIGAALGRVAGYVVLVPPGLEDAAWYQEVAALLLLTGVCTGAAHMVHAGGRAVAAKVQS